VREECDACARRYRGVKGLSGDGSKLGENADFVEELRGCRLEDEEELFWLVMKSSPGNPR
jgi:hypothetical protein